MRLAIIDLLSYNREDNGGGNVAAAAPGPLRPAARRAGEQARIPSLDGLRAVSISLVLLGHLLGTRYFFLGQEYHAALGPLASLGVGVFFVISGFLITTLLMDEQDRSGRISLKDFYIRRLFRIFPANYFYVAVIWACSLAGLIVLNAQDIWRAFSYTMNYHEGRSWYMGHLWSLSVEEQFYLLWPFVVSRVSRERAIQIAAAVVVLSPVIRTATALLAPSQVPLIGISFHTVADALAAGCLLAMCWERSEGWTRYQAFLQSRAFWLVPLAIAVSVALSRSWKFALVAGASISTVCVVMVIERFVRYPIGRSGAFLNWAPVRMIGVWSYSLYLWQQPFLNRNEQTLPWTSFPLNLAAAFVMAILSYYMVEKPFLALRKRVQPHSAKTRRAAAGAI
jgi:peptidoglycan/LPS O-acetylase OafA/YrhL